MWADINLIITIVFKILIIIVPLLLTVAYLTYAERKVIGFIQARIGPNRVGYRGLLQPFADSKKLLFRNYRIVIYFLSRHYLLWYPLSLFGR